MTKEWTQKDGKLFNKYSFNNYLEALDFVIKISKIAQEKNHHPDISFGWGYAEVSIYSHDKNAITERDHELAEAISKL